MIAALLGWTGLPQWALELLALAGVAAAATGAFWIYHHHVYVQGIHAQQVADQRASAKVVAQARAQTQAAEAAAARAHAAYLEEMSHEAIAAARRPLPAVRLCLDTYAGGSGVSSAGAPNPGNAHPGAGARHLPPLPAGDRRLRAAPGPNLADLLGLLAGRGDQVSAELREFQARGPK